VRCLSVNSKNILATCLRLDRSSYCFFVEWLFRFRSWVEQVYSGAEAMILGNGLNLNSTISLFITIDVRPGASPRLQCNNMQVPPLLRQRVSMFFKHLLHVFQRLPQFRK
jgi:hypothetical protein